MPNQAGHVDFALVHLPPKSLPLHVAPQRLEPGVCRGAIGEARDVRDFVSMISLTSASNSDFSRGLP